jgi:hypothetical protein
MDQLTTVVHPQSAPENSRTKQREGLKMLLDQLEPKSSAAPVIVIFGGNPHRRDEVLRDLATIGDLGAYGALSEDEGYELLLRHKDRVKLVLIGGRYTPAQRHLSCGNARRCRLQTDRPLLLIRPKPSRPPRHARTLVSTIVGGHYPASSTRGRAVRPDGNI